MAKVNWNLMSQQFGEAFNYTLENERRRAQQQQQFNQEMSFQNRQFDWKKSIDEQTLGISRENLALDKSQEERLGTTAKIDIMKSLTPSQEGGAGSMTGADWEKQTGVDLYPSGKPEQDFYSLFQESTGKPNWEFQTKVDESGKNMRYWVDKNNPSAEPIPFGEVYNEPNVTNINMPQPPKADKWADFGKYISTVKQGKYLDKENNLHDIPPELTGEYKTRARVEAYSKMLPNAYNFYKKNFEDTQHEKVSNQYFLAKVRDGLTKDDITPEEAQDLIDFSAYRSDLFEINK